MARMESARIVFIAVLLLRNKKRETTPAKTWTRIAEGTRQGSSALEAARPVLPTSRIVPLRHVKSKLGLGLQAGRRPHARGEPHLLQLRIRQVGRLESLVVVNAHRLAE